MWMKAFFYSQVLFYFRNLHICSKDEVKTNVVRISGTVSHDTAVHWTVLEQNRCFWWEAEPSGLHSGLTMAWLEWLETIRWEAGNLPQPPSTSLHLPARALLSTANTKSSHSTSPSERGNYLQFSKMIIHNISWGSLNLESESELFRTLDFTLYYTGDFCKLFDYSHFLHIFTYPSIKAMPCFLN